MNKIKFDEYKYMDKLFNFHYFFIYEILLLYLTFYQINQRELTYLL